MTIAPEDLLAREYIDPAPPSDQDDIRAPSDVNEEPPRIAVRIVPVVLAGTLSSAAAAWLSGSLIRGTAPVLIALLGVCIGASVTYLSLRINRPALQYGVIAVAAVVGAILITPEARGGTANLPGLVVEAIRGGGLLQPPIAFNPGWRFILVVLFAIVSTGAISTAVSVGRPKLAVMIPLPLVAGAALLQPEGHAIVASSVAIVLLVGGLAIAFGADLSSEDTRELARSFEFRRLLRGGAMLGLVVIGIALLAQAKFLFPTTQEQRIIPPRRPPNVPLEKDRELFVVRADFRGPLRVGVLDEYDGAAWLLPPEDPRRLQHLEGGKLPAVSIPAKIADAKQRPIAFHIADMSGESLPVPAGLVGLDHIGSGVTFDPRTSVPRLGRRLPQGLNYTALITPIPFAAELNAAPDPPSAIAAAFTTVPPAPGVVIRLLSRAPSDRFTRIQYLREQLYKTVELSGGGGPTEVTPARVATMLAPGALATPYEVTAAEALLSRWAGVPSRIGYGYYGGDPVSGGYSFRPKHGRVWLEDYFEGYGWVPLVGTPPRAAASLSKDTKLQDPNVRPSDDLLMVVYVPVRHTDLQLLFQIIRYWVMVGLLIAVGLAMLLVAYPIALKSIRSARRRRWGVAHGHVGRVLSAYAEFRDRCQDLNLGDVRDSPVAFVERFVDDEEHDELAWLVTRLFWGDLRRDSREDDLQAAAGMIASVYKRMAAAQSPVNRELARTSRVSLRDPYNDEVPNFYPRPIKRAHAILSAVVRPARSVIAIKRHRRASGIATMLIVSVVLGACARPAQQARAPLAFPPHLPPKVSLGLRFLPEPLGAKEYAKAGREGLVREGLVYTIHEGNAIQGALQVGVFKPEVDTTNADAQAEIEAGIGGAFRTYRFGTARIRFGKRPQQRLYLWFPPERNAMVLLILRNEYLHPEELVRQLVASVRGLDLNKLVPIEALKG